MALSDRSQKSDFKSLQGVELHSGRSFQLPEAIEFQVLCFLDPISIACWAATSKTNLKYLLKCLDCDEKDLYLHIQAMLLDQRIELINAVLTSLNKACRDKASGLETQDNLNSVTKRCKNIFRRCMVGMGVAAPFFAAGLYYLPNALSLKSQANDLLDQLRAVCPKFVPPDEFSTYYCKEDYPNCPQSLCNTYMSTQDSAEAEASQVGLIMGFGGGLAFLLSTAILLATMPNPYEKEVKAISFESDEARAFLGEAYSLTLVLNKGKELPNNVSIALLLKALANEVPRLTKLKSKEYKDLSGSFLILAALNEANAEADRKEGKADRKRSGSESSVSESESDEALSPWSDLSSPLTLTPAHISIDMEGKVPAVEMTVRDVPEPSVSLSSASAEQSSLSLDVSRDKSLTPKANPVDDASVAALSSLSLLAPASPQLGSNSGASASADQADSYASRKKAASSDAPANTDSPKSSRL